MKNRGKNGCIIEGSFVAACESTGYSNLVLMFTVSFIVCMTLRLTVYCYVPIPCMRRDVPTEFDNYSATSLNDPCLRNHFPIVASFPQLSSCKKPP